MLAYLKIDNASTEDHIERCGLLLYILKKRLEQSTGLFPRRDDTLAYPGNRQREHKKPHSIVREVHIFIRYIIIDISESIS